jgi:methyltransferase (TIGR00027 family)
LNPAVRARIAEQLDVIPLRVRAIDVEVRRAVELGCRQVVILGAGLDTRAFRMEALAPTHVFEVDHPATQAFKRRMAESLSPMAEQLHYVPVDFERDSLSSRLQEAGHRREVPTAWIWEGVVMYLSDEALRTTLRAVAAASALGSTLVLNYHEPDVGGRAWLRHLLLTSVWDEPQIGLRSRESMLAEVEAVGFHVVSDTGTADWATQFGAPTPDSRSADVARIAVAKRTSGGVPERSRDPVTK